MKQWQEILAKHGRETELGGDLIVGISTFIDDTEEKAINRAKKYFEENMKMFGPLGFVRGLSEEQISALGRGSGVRSAGFPTMEDAVKAGAWVVGPPERVTERLMELQEQYPGLEEVNVGASVMSTERSVILEQFDLFGKEVMPKFKAQAK
jgi:alkanesulfonate monooxygenase SsuD/methylene tetrahydromethanopterin reductase-like flavin-dependent oxidoreductase (luciferase family)